MTLSHDGPLAGKVALVTGGGRGIGAAIVRRLAADGASALFTYRGRTGDADALCLELGQRVVAIMADAADPATAAWIVAEAILRFGRLDIVVSNAGGSIVGPLAAYPPDAFDRLFALNVRAPFLTAQAAAAAVMTDGGRIVTIGSIIASRTPSAGAALYAASKSALVGMTRGLARDLGPRAITVNLVEPGPIDTERNRADGPDAAELHRHLAIKRHGSAAEVAALVGWLVSEAAGFATGGVYPIDGGFSA